VRLRSAALIAAALAFGAAAAAEEPGAAAAPPGPADAAAARQERFLYYLRTYPERPPDETLGAVAALVDQGPFRERDRAIYWLGSARLSLGDREGLRRWFAKLQREHPQTVWVERGYLGMGEAATQERRYAEALGWYGRADQAQDAAVRELARISRGQVLILQLRQRAAWAAQVAAALVALFFLVSALRLERRGLRALLEPPAEARVLWPVLGVLALIATQQDPPARRAVLEICAAGAVLSWLSGARLRALGPQATLGTRLLQGALALAAMGALAYAAVWRGDLVGMVLETVRAGPD
jgi:hypothetical protein